MFSADVEQNASEILMQKESKYMYEVYLRDRINPLTFGGLCNHIDYTNPKMCVFRNESEDEKFRYILAVVPIDNIAYITNKPYKSVDDIIKGKEENNNGI